MGRMGKMSRIELNNQIEEIKEYVSSLVDNLIIGEIVDEPDLLEINDKLNELRSELDGTI